MTQISVISLASAEQLKRCALVPFPFDVTVLVQSLNQVHVPPAEGGSHGHIKQLLATLESLLGVEETAEVPDISDPETPHAKLSDDYFGLIRDDSSSAIVTLFKGALRALYAVLCDIEEYKTSLTAVEIANILKLPLVNVMMVANDALELKVSS